MNYSYLDLIGYLLIYSFLGWVIEVVFVSIRDKQLRNRGFFNLPFCLSYGVAMDILIVVLPTMGDHYLGQYIACLIVSSVVTFLSGGLAKRLSRTELWKYQENALFAGSRKWLLLSLLQGLAFFGAYLLLHPVLFTLVNLLPELLVAVVCLVLGLLLAADFVLILVTLRRKRTPEQLEQFQARRQKGKRGLGQVLYHWVWRRLYKAYPNLDRMEERGEKQIFAKGVCFDKLVWVFLICSLLGDLIETVFCRFTAGVWMSRTSLIYGTFSVVWGIGAVVLTVVLQKLADKEDRYVFLAGFFVGGVYEYMCSVFTEVFFGTTFWDYSDMPFNFGGRTNLLFCVFWGLLAVVWIKGLYPRISNVVEKIPPVAGKILTWVLLVLLVLDALVSVAAMLRYVQRSSDPTVHNVIQQFLDQAYPDRMIEWVWPNMRLS